MSNQARVDGVHTQGARRGWRNGAWWTSGSGTTARRTSPVLAACDTICHHAGVDEEQTCGLGIGSSCTSLWKISTGTALVDSAPASHVARRPLQESGQDVQGSEPEGRHCHFHRAPQERTEE
ncbi:hypothetical protein FA95DRAFT_1568094, partial [Auriscalpium vulgare]